MTIKLAILILILFLDVQPHASACTIYLGKKIRFDMEISPKVPLFHPDVDSYLYPGCQKSQNT
jgi:hypothetical protein